MKLELPTKEEFDILAQKMDKILDLLSKEQRTVPGEWMKSGDVKRLLLCSDAALKGYRDKGIIPSRRIGGTFYYHKTDVEKLLGS